MKFTKEKPTKPGYYWAIIDNEVSIIEIYYIFGVKRFTKILGISLIGNNYTCYLTDANNFLWGDKIEKPEVE